MMDDFKLYLKTFHRKYFKTVQNKYILGRTACLGNEVLGRLGLSNKLVNHQKSRIDYLCNSALKQYRAKPLFVKKNLARPYIYGCIEHQVYDFFKYKQPEFIMMDSFSELTDQLFVHKKEGWYFLANYNDIVHSEEFSDTFECLGLLDENQLERSYIDFFEKLEKIYCKRTIFLHFPTTFDDREKFKARGKLIVQVLSELEKKYDFLHSIHIEDNYVQKAVSGDDDLKDFPYHYSDRTYEIFVLKVKAILNP